MRIDHDRSGHYKENILSITFMGVDTDINMDFEKDEALELKIFLDEILENEHSINEEARK